MTNDEVTPGSSSLGIRHLSLPFSTRSWPQPAATSMPRRWRMVEGRPEVRRER